QSENANGFTRKSAAPNSRSFTRSRTLSRAVRKRIGVRIPPRRSTSTTCQPSLFGNIISTMRRSNLVVRANSKPVSPSLERSTAKPASRRPLARKAAVFFSSSMTRIRIATRGVCVPSILGRRQGNHEPGKQECDCRREKTVATVRVQHEGLHVQEPECRQEHRPHRQSEKY